MEGEMLEQQAGMAEQEAESPAAPVREEVDVTRLRSKLADLKREEATAQQAVLATIEAKHAEFVAAAGQITDLRGNVHCLQQALKDLSSSLNEEPLHDAAQTTGRAPPQRPVAALQAVVSEHKRVKAELDAVDAARQVLLTVRQARSNCAKISRLIDLRSFEEAARETLQLASLLEGISMADPASEPPLVRAAKAQYYQLRSMLSAKLEEHLGQLLTFAGQSAHANVEPSKPAALAEVWTALDMLGLQGRHVKNVSQQAIRGVLKPLTEAARQIGSMGSLEAVERKNPGGAGCSWSWTASPCHVPEESSAPPVSELLPVLKSLFTFAGQHWAGGLKDVLRALGLELWPFVTRVITSYFDTCGEDDGACLEKFEAEMLQLGLIGEQQKRLSLHVQEHRIKQGRSRRAAVLAETRAWLLEDNGELVPVTEASDSASITQLLKLPRSAGADSCRSAGNLGERLRNTLQSDELLLRLPEMQVSSSTCQVAGRVRSLVEEAVDLAGKGKIEAAGSSSKLAREVIALFAVLRPFAQQVQLKTSARQSGIFLADCLYLAHVFLLMPFTHGSRLPQQHRHLAMFIDLVPQIRLLAESHFLSMLRCQQERLTATLEPCSFEVGISIDRRFVQAEAALGAAVQQLKTAAQGLEESLPSQLRLEMVGALLAVYCQNILGKIFSLSYAEPHEVQFLSNLVISALDLGRQVFLVADLDKETSLLKQHCVAPHRCDLMQPINLSVLVFTS
eukprot:TRINITY_DN40202_c0_g1_i1.p1 TRINITY_DN40202_c0_g1~~TRINITY_DN40202_c0_g1_i1.p1  ORF type:complete len:736 (+),score=219.49 TRINITY_DN40202_c0_g1_i1:92-2299(+)